MDTKTTSILFDVADYLETQEEIEAYLKAATEEGNEKVLLAAKEDACRAEQRIMSKPTVDCSHTPRRG